MPNTLYTDERPRLRSVQPYTDMLDAQQSQTDMLNETARLRRAEADRQAAAAKRAEEAAPFEMELRKAQAADATRKHNAALAAGDVEASVAPENFPGNADPRYVTGNPNRTGMTPELTRHIVDAYGASTLPAATEYWRQRKAQLAPVEAPEGTQRKVQRTIGPTGEVTTIESYDQAAPKPEGIEFPNAEAAIAAGYNPEGGDVLDNTGRIRITKLARSDRSRAKLDTNQKNSLSGAASASSSLNNIAQDYVDLNQQGRVGPIAGRWEGFKQAIGYGNQGYSEFAAQTGANLFTLARALQGAGVLTEGDVKRMETIVPTGTMDPSQFKGQLSGLRKIMLERLNAWKLVNDRSLEADERAQINGIIGTLNEDKWPTPGTPKQQPTMPAPAAPEAPAAPAAPQRERVVVNTQAEYDALPKGTPYVDSNGKPATKK